MDHTESQARPNRYLNGNHSVSLDPHWVRHLSPGAHLVTRRGPYIHHGVYVGEDRVVHYAGYAYGIRRRPIEEVSLEAFAAGKRVQVRSRPPGMFSHSEIVLRARSRLGEDDYRVLTNNCEHFCEWCFSGHPRSAQVESVLAALLAPLAAVSRGIASGLTVAVRVVPLSHREPRRPDALTTPPAAHKPV
jgi:hypothetical protein